MEERSWQDYLSILLRRRWWFLVPFVLILTGASVYGFTAPKVYESRTVILVQDEKLLNPLIQGLAISTTVGDRLRGLREEILSWPSLMELIKRLEMDKDLKDQLAYERKIEVLREAILVKMKGNDLFVISYRDGDARKAQEVVNAISDIFIQRNVAYQHDEASTAISFIEEQMTIYKDKLEQSEAELRRFKEVYSQEIPIATNLNSQIVSMEVELANLLVENTEAHPAVRALRQRIDVLRDRRNAEIMKVVANSAELELAPDASPEEVQRARQAAVDEIVARMESASKGTEGLTVITPGGGETNVDMSVTSDNPLVTLTPKQEQELARLTRNYNVNRGMYSHLQERLERAQISQRLERSDQGTKFRIIEPARLPLQPVSPNLPRILFMAFFLGALVGAGAAYGAEFLDGSFKESSEVKDTLDIPSLGSISKIITPDDIVERMKVWKRRAWVTVTATFCLVLGLAVTTMLIR